MNFLQMLQNLTPDKLYLIVETFNILTIDHPLELKELAARIRCRLEQGGIKLDLALTPGILSKKINEIEDMIRPFVPLERGPRDPVLFCRRRGGGKTWENVQSEPDASVIRRIIRDMQDCLDSFRLLGRHLSRETIRIGCTDTLGNWLLSEVVSDARQTLNNGQEQDGTDDYDVLFAYGLPQMVRLQGGFLGLHDIVVASCHANAGEDAGSEHTVPWTTTLPMRLVINRRDPLAAGEQARWQDLDGYTLLLQSWDRNPQPKYPFERFPTGLHLERVNSYAEAFAAVKASGSTGRMACLAFSHAHSPEQRLPFREFELEGLEPIHVGVFLPEEPWRRASHAKRKIVELLVAQIKSRLEMLARRGSHDYWSFFAKRPCATFNVSRYGDHFVWQRGELRNMSVTSDGHFQGDHVVHSRCQRNAIEFSIAGHVNRNDYGDYQMTWRGWLCKGQIPDEDYTVSIVFSDPTNPWVGTWMGKSTWGHRNSPDMGFFVVWPGLADERSDVEIEETLKFLIPKYYQDHAFDLPPLPIPGQIASHATTEKTDVPDPQSISNSPR